MSSVPAPPAQAPPSLLACRESCDLIGVIVEVIGAVGRRSSTHVVTLKLVLSDAAACPPPCVTGMTALGDGGTLSELGRPTGTTQAIRQGSAGSMCLKVKRWHTQSPGSGEVSERVSHVPFKTPRLDSYCAEASIR
jgi:hypothetical protein